MAFYRDNCKKLGNALRGQSGAFLNIKEVGVNNSNNILKG